ncbi:MAG: rRNA maturation RNase YbeY, partial [Syntrophales bacterium]
FTRILKGIFHQRIDYPDPVTRENLMAVGKSTMPIIMENRQKQISIDQRSLRRAMSRIMKYLCCSDKVISLLFVDDREIREINRRYLNRDYPTNVVSFSLTEGEFGDINPNILGDIVISAETAFNDAEESDIAFNDELTFLMIHGILHLLDYDHGNADQVKTQAMRKKERELFRMLKGYEIQ